MHNVLRVLTVRVRVSRISRKQRDREMETDRVLLRTIINTWKDIKALRQSTSTNTSVKLLIRKYAQQLHCRIITPTFSRKTPVGSRGTNIVPVRKVHRS